MYVNSHHRRPRHQVNLRIAPLRAARHQNYQKLSFRQQESSGEAGRSLVAEGAGADGAFEVGAAFVPVSSFAGGPHSALTSSGVNWSSGSTGAASSRVA